MKFYNLISLFIIHTIAIQKKRHNVISRDFSYGEKKIKNLSLLKNSFMQPGDYTKLEIREYIKDIIQGKIKTLEFYLNFTLDASRDIKKTTKYESFREEIQEEIYHLSKQLHELRIMQQKMQKIISSHTTVIQSGSLVITNKARFYISVSLGEFFFKNERFYAISPESPMAMIMSGKKAGDEFTLNNIHQIIEFIR